MRHLDRALVPAPLCLSNKGPTEDWDSLTWAEREEIRAQLGLLQHNHCAYCESDLERESNKPHIEHFVQRSRAKQKTFEWNNLFWSCSHSERCGKHKDGVVKTYAPADLLKPDVDGPRQYLWFTRDGEVFPRPSRDRARQRRAKETIRVFALDHKDLIAARRAYLAGPYSVLEAIASAGFTDEECRSLLNEEARAYEASAFSAAILDLFGVAP